ncbi:MAG: PadR family transcriptional regulator [Candidatus Micrarchaeia archaeon]
MVKQREQVKDEFKRMVIRFIILKKLSDNEIYAYRLLKDIEGMPHMDFFCKDKKKLKNDIYNALNALSKEGYIIVKQKKVGSKVRNYYSLTMEGRKSINRIRRNFAMAVMRIKKILRV